jgi:hypothetical protein
MQVKNIKKNKKNKKVKKNLIKNKFIIQILGI